MYIYTKKYYSVIKRMTAIWSNMDEPRDCHTEWSQSVRERQMSYNITYMWNLKRMLQVNLHTKQQYSHRCIKQTIGYRGEGRQG